MDQNYQASAAPVGQLKTNRSFGKYFLLNLVTFGIYGLIFYAGIADDIGVIAGRYDGKKTMNFYLLTFIVGPLTFAIAYLVWYHKISNRVGNELNRRGINYNFGAGTYWLWTLLLPGIGSWIYTAKLAKAMNLLAGHYNVNG